CSAQQFVPILFLQRNFRVIRRIPPMAMATPRLTATAIRLTTAATPGRTTAPMPTRVPGRCGGASSISPGGADDFRAYGNRPLSLSAVARCAMAPHPPPFFFAGFVQHHGPAVFFHLTKHRLLAAGMVVIGVAAATVQEKRLLLASSKSRIRQL